jgi:hypothetical protein
MLHCGGERKDEPGDKRSEERVGFEQGILVCIMGLHGTWRRECRMVDVSRTGARLLIEGSCEGLDLKEFFLLLSSTGLAYRRCRTVQFAGDQIRVEFVMPNKAAGKKKQFYGSLPKRMYGR